MSQHVIATTHIQKLIKNALKLAETVDGERGGTMMVMFPEVFAGSDVPARECLVKAVADLRHAADELEAEYLSTKGWKQVL